MAEDIVARLKKITLSAGYSEEASERILGEYFEAYMLDINGFQRMLAEYKAEGGHAGEGVKK